MRGFWRQDARVKRRREGRALAARRGAFSCLLALLACTEGKSPAPEQVPPPPAPTCPTGIERVERAPEVPPALEQASTWIDALPQGEAERVLMGAEAIASFNGRAAEIDGAWRALSDPRLSERERLDAQIRERVDWMRGQVQSGNYLEVVPGSFARAEARVQGAEAMDEFRAVAAEASLRCMPLAPSEALLKPPAPEVGGLPDPDFDRNNCASLHPGEWVRVLGHYLEPEAAKGGSGDWYYVHAGHSVGWLNAPTWTPALDAAGFERWQSRTPVFPLDDETKSAQGRPLRLGSRAYLVEEEAAGPPEDGQLEIWMPSETGWTRDRIAAARVHVGPLPLTRRQALDWAFSELGSPYGWGGRAGERDCSRYLRDLGYGFGLELARHSAVQSQHAPERIDVSALDDAAKRAAILEAQARGLVFAYMPGHIMMILGEAPDTEGQPQIFGISSISEFLVPCAQPGGPDATKRLDRVAVTTLELGRGTSRRAFIERITTLVVLSEPASEAPASEDEAPSAG